MTPEELFGQFLGLGKAWCGLEGRLRANPSRFVLKVDETTQLWPEENARAGIPDGQIRQVGKSADDITLPVQGPARGLGGDYPGGDACFGPRPATSTPHGLTTENSAQIPWVGETSHRGVVVFGVCSQLGLSDHFSQIIYFCLRIFLFLFDSIDHIFSRFYWLYTSFTPVD